MKPDAIRRYHEGAVYACKRLGIGDGHGMLLLMWGARLALAKRLGIDDPFARGVVDTLIAEDVRKRAEHARKSGAAAYAAGKEMLKRRRRDDAN